MLVLTIILGVLNLFLGFALATYLGHGPAGVIDVLNIFGSRHSKSDSQHEDELSHSFINETTTVTEQSPPEPPPSPTSSLQQPAEIVQSEPEIQHSTSEIGQSMQYTVDEAISEEMDLDLVCNEVS
jgi:hypothetical protein